MCWCPLKVFHYYYIIFIMGFCTGSSLCGYHINSILTRFMKSHIIDFIIAHDCLSMLLFFCTQALQFIYISTTNNIKSSKLQITTLLFDLIDLCISKNTRHRVMLFNYNINHCKHNFIYLYLPSLTFFFS